MSTTRRRWLLVTATSALLAGTIAPAAAHVTIQPAEAEAGSVAVVAFRVPNERDNASTTKVRVLMPEDQPVGSVRTTPVPGWRVETRTRTLDEPIEMYGEEVDEVVSGVTWTATGDGIGPDQFEDFELNLGPLPESGEMVFSAIQSYSNGEEVAWNEVAVDDATEVENPAPVLEIVPAAAEAAEGTEGTGDTGSTATWSLVASLVALVLAAVALVVSLLRRRG